jgi:hypothetical protein
MLMQPLEAVSAADALDAIRQIANMIAGVLKSSLPRPCAMALPKSTVATEGLCTSPCRENTLVVAFRHTAGGLVVRVWEEECGQQQGNDGTREQGNEGTKEHVVLRNSVEALGCLRKRIPKAGFLSSLAGWRAGASFLQGCEFRLVLRK